MMKVIFMVSFMMFMITCCSMFSFYSMLCFLMTLIMLFMFKFDMLGLVNSIYSGYLFIDKSSFSLILLSLWILGLMYMSLDYFSSYKEFTFIFMLLVLMMFFLSSNLLMMYLFFELSLIPTYLMIVYWGSNPERVGASFYLLIYMLLISLPLLFYIYYIMGDYGSLVFSMFDFKDLMISCWWDYLIMVGAFLIKLPIYIFHIWLPKAHVEAPVYGSMILAAVLLKLGGYGLYRMMMCMKFDLMNHMLVMSIGLVGGILVSFISMIQVDMKSLVAYSSVVHMNLMLSGLLTMYMLGWSSSMLIMLSHGLCSSGLFYMVNMYYERSSSRLLILNKGMVTYMPTISIFWFLLCSSNFSYPLSLNFFGEITLLMTLLSWSYLLLIVLIIVCFFSGSYSLYLFSYVYHGQFSYVSMSGGGMIKEMLVALYHYLPLVVILFDLLLFY